MIELALAVALFVSTVFTFLLLALPSQYVPKASAKVAQSSKGRRSGTGSVQVLVLGDIGRSPRMQYHALSIAKHGGFVQVIGYAESDVHPDLLRSERVAIVPIASSPRMLQTSNKWFFLLFAPLKVLHQILSLWLILCYKTEPTEWLLVQNPPSIPTLAMAHVTCFLRNTKLIIDWHNFGYSILGLKLGDSHVFVRASKWYEKTLSRYAVVNFTVTGAMTRILKDDFKVRTPILPLHDRPAFHLHPLKTDDKWAVLARLPQTSHYVETLATGKTRLLVSSTSWTPDEDFSVLISALCEYSEMATSTHPQLPEILAIITGKGPQKQFYLDQVAWLKEKGKLEMVTITLAWFTVEDYAALLASADLGVSLHTSSSGVDLPMKVVDMFGVGLPVAGWDRFEAWPELVTEGVNGKGFGSAEELTQILVELFGGDGVQLKALKEGALKESTRRWDDEWDPIAGKLLRLL